MAVGTNPITGNSMPALEALPPDTIGAYIARPALEMAMAALETVDDPTSISHGATWLDPSVSMALSLYVQNAQPGEDRATARQRIETAMAGDPATTLSLKGLGLLELPPVIPNVHTLDLSDNRLATLLPLPCDIRHLNLANNWLEALTWPLPARLDTLNLSHNKLTTWPKPLTARLISLNASNNDLNDLPEELPSELRVLDVRNNRADLTELASRRLNSLRRLRVLDAVMGAPGASRTRAFKNMDVARCDSELRASMVPLLLVKA